MTMTDPIADLLTRIRNAQAAGHAEVECLASRMNEYILKVLKDEGYIESYVRKTIRPGIDALNVTLRYYEGRPVIQRLVRLSKPGRRVYSPVDELQKSKNGLGVVVVSTSHGVMSDAQARKMNLGGEVLFEVF